VKRLIVTVLLIFLTIVANADDYAPPSTKKKTAGSDLIEKLSLSGSIYSDILFPQKDEKIGAMDYSETLLTNTYADLMLSYNNRLTLGGRFEFLEHPLPGFEKDFKDWGVPHFYLSGQFDKIEFTAGDFYEQFGSGLILRLYEERSLGIDNALRGGKIVIRPLPGIQIKALGGQQRRYWDHNEGAVWGSDLTIDIDQWVKSMSKRASFLSAGFSYVGKHEQNEDIHISANQKLNLPLTIAAFDTRLQYQYKGYNLLAEYAWKINDPSFDNGYSYDKGNALFLSGSYSRKGMSLLLQARRNENMSFRSKRSMTGSSSFINHLPAFSTQHTYALAALYPYATQPNGEWAYQGEFTYSFSRGSTLGGKHGTKLSLHGSYIRPLHTDEQTNKYYQDIHLKIEKRFSSSVKLDFMYMNQQYNQKVIEGHADNGNMIRSNIFIGEGLFKLNSKLTLRGELQYLETKQDQGDWLYGLAELSVYPSLMLTVSDMYNVGETDTHYYMASAAYLLKAHRLQIGYGRTRAGYNCSGGICRYVPATKGFQLLYNYTF